MRASWRMLQPRWQWWKKKMVKQFIYISPGGQRFTSLQQVLQYAQNNKLQNRFNAEMQALQMESFDRNSNIHVQFTSNHKDYLHRGGHPIMQALPAYVYNMWVYGARKQSSQGPLGDYVISFDYDVDYKPSALVRTQRLSLIPKIPQLEGMQVPSPDVDPHKMSLIKLLLFKPFKQSNDMDEKGNPLDPYRATFLDAENAQKKMKRGEQENPYDVFPRAWKQYWQETVLPKAADVQKKIEARMELPTLWECLEVFQLQKDLCQEKYLIPSDEDWRAQAWLRCTYQVAEPLDAAGVCVLSDEKTGQERRRLWSLGSADNQVICLGGRRKRRSRATARRRCDGRCWRRIL